MIMAHCFDTTFSLVYYILQCVVCCRWKTRRRNGADWPCNIRRLADIAGTFRAVVLSSVHFQFSCWHPWAYEPIYLRGWAIFA